ncbi:hypothetical protein [Flavobacterium restrictum]|uniref:Uncharacterized protein n=1 Tax=Flavobacterium restrictum TaxID=2594428 RepID=A0A553EAQ6_9FLAO|nr:hypothetical protein [Flavobacterium restrictum]TRX42157.1 hypothetical protein FNW21_02495 [Flavobacterium restrictum]
MKYLCCFLIFIFINCKSLEKSKPLLKIENPFNITCNIIKNKIVNLEIINNTLDDFKINKLNNYCYLNIKILNNKGIYIEQSIKIKVFCDGEFVDLKHNEKLSFKYDYNLEELFKDLLKEKEYTIQLIYNGKLLKNTSPVILKDNLILQVNYHMTTDGADLH